MGKNTEIAWTKHTHNPWFGCVKVSPGCEKCYAEEHVTKRMRLPVWGPAKTTERKRASVATLRQPITWNNEAAQEHTRFRVFCASLADIFEDHPQVEPWRRDLFDVIERTPNLDWQLLTKRPENLKRFLPQKWIEKPRSNVWLGTTVEDQKRARERIPHLLATPAAVRFLSCEPLLEEVTLDPPICANCGAHAGDDDTGLADDGATPWCIACDAEMSFYHWLGSYRGRGGISWVIVGGESGPGARPFDVAWGRRILEECRDTETPCFFKQMGSKAIDSDGYDVMNEQGGISYTRGNGASDYEQLRKEAIDLGRTIRPKNMSRFLRHRAGADPSEWDEEFRVRQFPFDAAEKRSVPPLGAEAMSETPIARVVQAEDGTLVLHDPEAAAFFAAVENHNRALAVSACEKDLQQHLPRLQEFADRVLQRDSEERDVVVLLSADDERGALMLSMLMPDEDWNAYRERGEVPYGRGIAPRELITEMLSSLELYEAEHALVSVPQGHCFLVVVAHNTAYVETLKGTQP